MSLAQANVQTQTLIPHSPEEHFFSVLYGAHMRTFPKKIGLLGKPGINDVDRQWVFVGNKERMKSVATQVTLYAILSDPSVDTSFYTPNGYYRRDQRLTESLRWLNAFVLDLDHYDESLQDVFDRIDRAGLPSPTAIIRTPSGGHHVAYFFSNSVRATDRAVQLYSAILRHMATDLGADLAAVGANRIFRTPTERNMIYFKPDNRYDFEDFKTWRELNHPYNPANAGYINIQTGNLMDHLALQHLLTAPCLEGQREQTALTLALAMKASGWPQAAAEDALQEWYISCCDKGAKAGKKPFTLRDAVYKAGYVYRKSNLNAPKAETIRELTGLPFYYVNRSNWDCAKPRSERTRVHLQEWRTDLITLLEREKELSGTQQEMATRLDCPIASFKAVLAQLKAEGKVIVEVRKGRTGTTSIRLPGQQQKVEDVPDQVIPVQSDSKEVDPASVSKPQMSATIIHADFKERKIQRVERQGVFSSPEPPPLKDPEPPD